MEFNEILRREDTFRYMMLDRMRTDCEYYLGNGNRHAKNLWAKNEVEQIAYMKALWNSFGEDGKPEWLSYYKILDYEQKMGIKAILVEMDYKGSYERFALTPEEFEKEFPDTFKTFDPIKESNSDTLKPLVHIWFKPCVVGDDAWERHFTDMKWGLPESDIEAGNLAYIDREQMQSLNQYLEDTSVYHCRAVFEREGVSLEKLAKSEILCQISAAMPYPDHRVSNMACVEEGPSDGATDMADARVLIFEFDISMPRDSVSDINEILGKVDGGELLGHHYERSEKSVSLDDRIKAARDKVSERTDASKLSRDERQGGVL